MMQHMYRKHCKGKYSTTFYRLDICAQSTVVRLSGFTIDKSEGLKTRLQIVNQLLSTTEEKDNLYEQTEHCTEQEYNDWLLLYNEIHDTCFLRVIGDRSHEVILKLF